MNEFTNSHTGDAMTPCDRLLTDARYEGTAVAEQLARLYSPHGSLAIWFAVN